ncbi:MAG: hypothetical protein M5U09_12975 [Gammaproteobacteria bacterium]|nr:hypothetical protein [Gammaproteobacteria bacterium]
MTQQVQSDAPTADFLRHADLPHEHRVILARRHVGEHEADHALVGLGHEAGVAEMLADEDVGVRLVELQHAGLLDEAPHLAAVRGRRGPVDDVSRARSLDSCRSRGRVGDRSLDGAGQLHVEMFHAASFDGQSKPR